MSALPLKADSAGLPGYVCFVPQASIPVPCYLESPGRRLTVKLFYAPGSSSLLPHIVLHEAGLPFTAIKIDEHSKVIEGGGDYKKVNPLGYVPTLVLDDGTLLTEGAAIVQYIADQVPSKKLVPPNGTIERAMLQAWLNFCSSEMHSSTKVCRRKAKRSSAPGWWHGSTISMSISKVTSISWGAITQ
jgi:hypothetical protein